MTNATNVKQPLITVVIASKNRHHLLPRAIESVLAQSYAHVEVVVVDDGSDTPVVYSGGDGRVRVLRNEKSVGLSAARNVGFAAARGEFFAMLDDDDFYFEDKIERQLRFLEENPAIDMVFSRVAVQDAEGRRHYYLTANHTHTAMINLKAYNVIHPASVLMRRAVFEQVQFEPTLKKYEDTLFFNQVCVKFETAYLPMDAAVWMQDGRADQLTRVFYKRNFDNFRIVCDQLAPVINAHAELRRRYYGRLSFQALRCLRFGKVSHALLKAVSVI